MDVNGISHRAVLNPSRGGEVIISSGAIGSPQILLLSGIGPREQLESFGIPVVLDLPGVGQGMADNPKNGITVISPLPLEYSLIQVVGILPETFIKASSAPIYNRFYESGGPLENDPEEVSRSQITQRPDSSDRYIYMGSIIEKIAGPLSKGELHLRSVDIKVNPSVRFNYFSNRVDLQNCVNGLRTISKVLKTRSLRDYTMRFIGPQLPANTSDNEAMEAFCLQTMTTLWHYHGGCQVGTVVNENYQVLGIDSLLVIDGSTFSVSPGTNPQAAVMMLGR